jgi:hypothetical protein
MHRSPGARCAGQGGLEPRTGRASDDDSSPSFPIQGQDMTDASVPAGEATEVFFGTSNRRNSAREAERLAKLYSQFRGRLHFLIVDLNHLAPGQATLAARYYHGYIPTIAVIDSHGKVILQPCGRDGVQARRYRLPSAAA